VLGHREVGQGVALAFAYEAENRLIFPRRMFLEHGDQLRATGAAVAAGALA
jgi:hypothetical protein